MGPVLLLEIRRAAKMIGVPVPDDDHLHVRRVEPDLLQRRLDDFFGFLHRVERVDQDDALAGRNRPRANRVEAEVIEVVENLDRVDLPQRLGRQAGVLAQHSRTLRAQRTARLLETALQLRVVAGNRLRLREERLRLFRVLVLIVGRIAGPVADRGADRPAARPAAARASLLRADLNL